MTGRCPVCRALPDQRCRSPRGNPTASHPERYTGAVPAASWDPRVIEINARSVTCPTCRAPRWSNCFTASGRHTSAHASRVDASR